MDEYDDDGRTDPDPSDIDALSPSPLSPSRPGRAPRPNVFERRTPEDEERTQFMDRSKSAPPRAPEPAPSRPSRPSAPTRSSVRPPRVQLQRAPLEEPTVFKPHTTTQRPPPPASRRSSPPPPPGAQDVMSWPAATAMPRDPAPRDPMEDEPSLAPRPAAGRPAPARNSQPPLFLAPVGPASAPKPERDEPSVIVPLETKSTEAVVKDRGFQSETSVVSKPPKRPPVYVLAGGFGLLGTLLAFGAVVGITSVVRSSSAAAGGKVALHPPAIMAAAVAVSPLTQAPAVDPQATVATTPKAGDPATATAAAAGNVGANAGGYVGGASRPAPDHDTAAPHMAPRPPTHVYKTIVRPPPPPPVVVATAPKPPAGQKGTSKGTKADIDDAKAAEELARAQLEASLK